MGQTTPPAGVGLGWLLGAVGFSTGDRGGTPQSVLGGEVVGGKYTLSLMFLCSFLSLMYVVLACPASPGLAIL